MNDWFHWGMAVGLPGPIFMLGGTLAGPQWVALAFLGAAMSLVGITLIYMAMHKEILKKQTGGAK